MRPHPETAIAPYLRGELDPAERARVETHLAGCAPCAQTADDFRALMGLLTGQMPPPPVLHAGRYRAELYEKLGERLGGRRAADAGSAWWKPVPLVLSAALAGVLLFIAVHGVGRDPQVADISDPRGVDASARVADLSIMEEAALGTRIDLLRQYALLEQLDLLEDLDVIRNLDRVAG